MKILFRLHKSIAKLDSYYIIKTIIGYSVRISDKIKIQLHFRKASTDDTVTSALSTRRPSIACSLTWFSRQHCQSLRRHSSRRWAWNCELRLFRSRIAASTGHGMWILSHDRPRQTVDRTVILNIWIRLQLHRKMEWRGLIISRIPESFVCWTIWAIIWCCLSERCVESGWRPRSRHPRDNEDWSPWDSWSTRMTHLHRLP
jgi:hypothetical protein